MTPLIANTLRGGGNVESVKALLDAGVDPKTKMKNGASPLHYAVSKGNLEVAQYLLTHGVDIEQMDGGGKTALHAAAMDGAVSVVRWLLALGADVMAKTVDDKTARDLIDTGIHESEKWYDTVALLTKAEWLYLMNIREPLMGWDMGEWLAIFESMMVGKKGKQAGKRRWRRLKDAYDFAELSKCETEEELWSHWNEDSQLKVAQIPPAKRTMFFKTLKE
eukprot:1014784-Prymnesium_polylepis.1